MWLRRGGRGGGGPPPWARPHDDRGGACVDMAARDGHMGCHRGVAARMAVGGMEGELRAAAANEATRRPRWTAPPWT